MTPGHEPKLRRAREHLDTLKAETDAWLRSKPYRLSDDVDVQTGEKLLMAELTEPVPTRFSAIVGDFVHNMRSALDNLVYDLADAHTGVGNLTQRQIKDLAFPMWNKPPKADEERARIGPLKPEARAFIKEAQPHTRGDESSAYLPWILHDLSVKDKHRFPHLGVLHPERISFFKPGTSGFIVAESTWGTLEGRAEIARYSSSDGNHAVVDMNNPPTFFVGFGEGSEDSVRGKPVVAVLREMERYVSNEIVAPLVRHL